jgi:hypothetical protein
LAAKPPVRSSASDQSGRGLLGDPAPWELRIMYIMSSQLTRGQSPTRCRSLALTVRQSE